MLFTLHCPLSTIHYHYPPPPCSQKVALITGSGKHRIGNAVAMVLAESGYDIAVHYHRSDEEARETVAGDRAEGRAGGGVSGRLTDEVQVARLFDETLAPLRPARRAGDCRRLGSASRWRR